MGRMSCVVLAWNVGLSWVGLGLVFWVELGVLDCIGLLCWVVLGWMCQVGLC